MFSFILTASITNTWTAVRNGIRKVSKLIKELDKLKIFSWVGRFETKSHFDADCDWKFSACFWKSFCVLAKADKGLLRKDVWVWRGWGSAFLDSPYKRAFFVRKLSETRRERGDYKFEKLSDVVSKCPLSCLDKLTSISISNEFLSRKQNNENVFRKFQ